jgi:hypothetical protein
LRCGWERLAVLVVVREQAGDGHFEVVALKRGELPRWTPPAAWVASSVRVE